MVAAANNIYSRCINMNTGRTEVCSEENKSAFCSPCAFLDNARGKHHPATRFTVFSIFGSFGSVYLHQLALSQHN